MLKRLEVRVLLKESDFLPAGLRGRGRGAYPPSQFTLFHPSRKQRWRAPLEYLKRVLRKELFIEVRAGIKGINRGCWETVPHLAVNRKCQAPAEGPQLLVTWVSCLPSLELIISPFLICMLLLMVLPLVMIFLVLLYLKKYIYLANWSLSFKVLGVSPPPGSFPVPPDSDRFRSPLHIGTQFQPSG